MRRCMFAAAYFLLLAGCRGKQQAASPTYDTLPGGIQVVHNTVPTLWHDSTSWHFVEITRIAPGDSGAATLVNPGFSAVVDPAGRTYVADDGPARIKVFDSTGRYVRAIGRDGEGPGEYRAPFLAMHGNYLIVHDPQLRRVTVFDTAGSVTTSFASTCCVWGPQSLAVDDSGQVWTRTLLAPNDGNAVVFVRFDITGRVLDTLRLAQTEPPAYWVVSRDVEGGHSTSSYKIPGGADELVGVTPQGGVVRSWSSRYVVVVEDGRGDTTLVFDRSWTPVPVQQEERVQRFSSITKMLEPQLGAAIISRDFHLRDIPTERPPMRELAMDPAGRTWVRTASADTSASSYDVFSARGIWQGTVRAPWHSSADVVWRGTDRVLVREADENGLASFVVYRLVSPE